MSSRTSDRMRAHTLPARLKRESLKRDAPSIWDLQNAMRQGSYQDSQDDLASEASVGDGRDSELSDADTINWSGAQVRPVGGSWPRRKQRTQTGVMSIWEVHEALGGSSA